MGWNAGSASKGEKECVTWDSKKLINGHLLIVGKSGTGKTYTLKRMLKQLAKESRQELRVHIMDVHGDIDIEGASTVKFSEATQYGFNPLSINPDPDFGGVRKRIQSFISTLNRTGYRLGNKQIAVVRNLLEDLYRANGFDKNNPQTWKMKDGIERAYPKKNPTLEDAVRFANAKLRAMFLGTSAPAVEALERLYRKQTQWYKKLKKIGKVDTNSLEYKTHQDELKSDIEAVLEVYREHLEKVQTGYELDDLIKYDSRDVMKSVVDKLENLQNIGIFRSQVPPFDRDNPIWRYDIRSLQPDEKKIFVSFILEAIFLRSTQRGIQDDLVEIIILDEAHLFLTEEDDNPINVIAKEARKFGLGLFAASQSPTHFSDDFLSNVSTKIILGLDQMFWEQSERKLKVEQKALEWIVPTKRILMQMNNRGETRNQFVWTNLDSTLE